MGISIKSNTARILASLKKLKETRVMVGVPAANTERQNDSDEVNNATIGYNMEYGMPANNVPARPHLVPGVAAVEPEITERFRRAAVGALIGDAPEVQRQYSAAGQIAVNSVKALINSNIAPALSPYTIANRNRQRNTKSQRASEKEYAKLLDYGMSPMEAQDSAGIVALVNTGQYRNSITYVLRKI